MDLRRLLNEGKIHAPILVELFVLFNLAFLILDVYIAHSFNSFRHPAEWIPILFCFLAVPALPIAYRMGRGIFKSISVYVGLAVGILSILVGLGGMFYHLESHFFQERTMRNLVYSAPFVAPLAFTGLGFLLILNRKVDHTSPAYAKWVLFFGWGGCVGNFGLSLVDHAQNGFFFAAEWIPVVAGAIAVAFFGIPVFTRVSKGFVRVCLGVVGLQVIVGLVGFVLHLMADLTGPPSEWFSAVVFGAPPFAPLLFVDLVIPVLIGLWILEEDAPRAITQPASAF